MTTYPVTLPAGGIASARIRHINMVAMSRSQFTGETQKQRWQGERFEFDVTYRPYSYRNAQAMRAALASLFGNHGTLLFGDPDYIARGPTGELGGTPLVDGALQPIASETLETKGWTPNIARVLAAGDMFQLGTGATARLHMVTADANSSAGGLATLSIWPRLRSSPADGAAIVVTGAKGVFEMAGPIIEYSTDQRSVYAFAFTVRESL